MNLRQCNFKDYTLFELQLPKEKKVVEVREPVNHIWIFDRSGSMYGLLSGLCGDMIKHMNQLPENDTFTLGWFSSEGEYNWILKGMLLNDRSKVMVADTIRKHDRTVALTCFSEILGDTPSVINDLSSFPGLFNLMFFTDGYPVVSNHTKEINAVMKALGVLSSKVSNAILVGYGSYYNKELMAQMTEKIGGALVHSERLADFTGHMVTFLGAETTKRVAVRIPSLSPLSVVGVDNNMVVNFPVENQEALVPESIRSVYVLQPSNHLPDLVGFNSTIVKSEEMVVGLMACAFDLISKTKTEIAVDLLGEVGDVFLIDQVINAWTNAEYGEAQKFIATAINTGEARFLKGKNKSYVPDPNAFCLLDALDILAEDDEAYFLPRHKEFEYKRIGVKTEPIEGSLKFEESKSVYCKFGDLVWNSTKLNLSLRAQIHGFVTLPEDAPFEDKTLSCFKWRNYTIVKDGNLNVTRLPAKMTDYTFERLTRLGMAIEIADDDTYIIALNSLPIVNQYRATAPLSTEFVGWLNRELELEYHQKYLKWYIEENDPSGAFSQKQSDFTPDQEVYLAQYGIKPDRSFSPKVVAVESTDYYYAKEFDVKIKSFSSAPKISEVLDDLQKGKSLTPSKFLMNDIVKSHKFTGTVGENVILANRELEEVKRDLKVLRKAIQSTRFAVLLCKRWFPDLATRDGAVVKLGDREFTFSIRDVKENY